MFLSCPNASAVQSISHEGKVVLVATVTSDGVSSLRYSVKQDGFEQTALQNPLGSGWESFKPLPLPTDSIGDASVEQWEARELSDSDGRPLLRSLYRSAQLTADAPVQLISHDGAIHVFRQSRRGTLLVDRFVLDGMTNTLNPKYEVRYKRSRQRLAPSKTMKQRPDGQLESLDGLDFRDMQNQFFTEPSIEICAPLAEGIRDGNFAVVVVPTTEPDHYRWHIFHANAGDSQVQCLSLRSGEDQVFSLYDYTKTSLDPLTNTTTYTLLHGVIQRSIALVSTRGQSLRVTNGLAAVLYDVQREQQTAAGPQLLLDATKLMLAVPTDAGVMALNFALAADGTLARINADSTETILRSKQREVLLPLSVMDEIRAVGDATPAPGGTIQAISRSTGDSNADRVRVSVADGEQAQLERLRKGDVVRLFNTTTYNGLYAVRSVDNGAFCIDAPFRYDDVGEWEKLEEEDNGLVFDGLITGYEKTGDGVVKVEAVNHGLLAGDLVQIVESPDVGGEYQILERDAQGFTVQRLWGSAEAVNVKIAMRKRRGLVFDGKSDGIRAELATTVHLAKGFTLETWVKLSRSGNQTLVATVPESPAPGVAQRCWQALLGIKAGKLNVTYRPINLGATEAVSLSAKQKAPLQEWLHVACSFDGEQLRLMQNGEEVASLAGSALEQAAAAGHAALLEALTADANQAAADLSTSGLPADHPCNYLAGRWVCRSSEQLLTPEDGGTAALGWPSEQLQQSWTVERQAPDRFSLRHSGSGQVLNHGGRLVRWQNKPDQLWSLRATGGGWYQLCSPESNQVLAADGSQVRLVVAESSAGDTSEQLWRFDPIGATKVNIAQTALAAARLLAPRPGQGIPVAVAALTMAGHEEAGSWKAPFQGQLSDLRFWDSGRPAQQVSHAMHLQMLGRERGLLGSWRLGGVASDDDGVQRVFDFSVNANHGVVRGAPYDGGILLGRTLRDQTTAAVMFSNGDLVAVSEGAIYVESFEFRTDPSLDPRNADGKQGAIFAPSLWGRSSRGAEEKQAITATQEGFQFEELGEGWWRASSRFVIPQGVRLLRCFELAQVRGSWSTLELRRHGLNIVSDTVTLSLADEQAQLSLASGEAALALGQEDMAAQLAKAEQTAKAALEMAALSQSQLEKEKADPRHFTRINLVQDSAQQWPVAATSYKAIALNGKEDCVTLPPAAMPTGAEITISFWLRCTGSSPEKNCVIAGLDAAGVRTIMIHIPWIDGMIHFDCGHAGANTIDRASKAISWEALKNLWTHWAFTKNASTGKMRIYRNGEAWAEATGKSATIPVTLDLRLGSFKAQEGFFPGSVDQLQIWSRECSQAEIQAGMRQPLKGTELGLCGYWRGWEGQFFDFSPHKRHGRLEGAPTWTASVLESTPLALVTDTLPAFYTSPEGQWEQWLQTDASGEVSGQLLWRGAKANPRFLGRLASTDGERPTLLDDSDPERIRWILEPGEKAGAYALRAPGQTLTYLGWNTSYRFKTPARFLRFDGKQDYADVPFKAGVHDLKAFTVGFWVRFAKGQFGSPLTCRSAPAAGLSGFMFYVDDRDQVQFILGRSTEWVAVISPKVTSDSWIHVCGSYDGKAIRLYINGEPVGSKDCTDYRSNADTSSRPLRLGAGKTEASADYAYKGDLAEVSIWNQPLSSERIKAFMYRSLSSIDSNLVAYYPLSSLDTIAGKKRCLLDRAGKNPGQVVGGTPQLITVDEQTSGFRLDYAPENRGYSFKTPARCLRFDGKQDYADVPFKAGVHDLKVFTVAFWVRFDQGQFGSPLTCRSAPAAGLSGFMFYVDEKEQIQFSVGRSSDWLTVFSSKLSPNTWVHVCGSYDGQAIRLYVNGELAGSQDCKDYRPNVAASNSPLRLGAGSTESTPNHFLKGDVAEVSLWNQPLNSPQIKAFMNRSLSGREPNLVAYYPLLALDTIAGKERCLLDRAGQNPGQVRSGAPQLIEADRLTSGFCMDPEFLPLCLDAFPMGFQLKPVAGTETPAGALQIQAAAAKYAAAEEQAKQAAEQLAELRAMMELLAELNETSEIAKNASPPALADLLPPLAAAESREAELVSRKKWLEESILKLNDLDRLRAERNAQLVLNDQCLSRLDAARQALRNGRNDIRNYNAWLLIGVESGRYMVTFSQSWRPSWGDMANLGMDQEGATVELDHNNFARGRWEVLNLIGSQFCWTVSAYPELLSLYNSETAFGGGYLLCCGSGTLSLSDCGTVSKSTDRQFRLIHRRNLGGDGIYTLHGAPGGVIGSSSNEWAASLYIFSDRPCEFRIIGFPGREHDEGRSNIERLRARVSECRDESRKVQHNLDDLTAKLEASSERLRLYRQELIDVTGLLAGQRKRIQMLRSIFLTRLSASQSQAQVLPTLPEQEDPRGLIVQGGAIPFPRAASRLTASAGCNGILSVLYHDPHANLVRARYDTAYDADGRGEEWIPDGFHAALGLEGTRSILGLPAALFRPLNQQITLEFWARCDSSHPNEVVFLVGLDRQNRPLLRIQLPNAKEEVVWEAGASPSDGRLDRLSCSVPASLYREAWTHWAFVKDAERGEMHIYANGQLLASHIPEAGGAKPMQQPLWGICRAALGGEPGASQAWQGQISELRLWNRALSPRTLESNSVLTLAGNEPGLLAYYPLNEASGEFARDHSGQGFSMRITGASWVPCTAPMGRLPEQQPTALIRDMAPLAGKQPLALPPVGLKGGGFSLSMRLRVEAFLPTTTLVELATEDQSDVLSMGYLPAKQLWSLQQRVKGVVHSLEFKLELNANVWVHLAFTISAKGEVLAYRNGVAVGSGLLPLPTAGLRTANVAGGGNTGAASAYPARIEHLRVWDKALSGWEIARQALHAPGFGHAVLAEYSRVVIDAQKRKNAMMMRCLAIANSDGIALLDEQWIENLEMKWVGNTQINPTLIGYIEGAPPIPSENLTEEDDYNGATSVELVQSSDVAYSWTREQDVSLGAEIEVLLGAQSETTAGTPFVQTTLEEVKTGLGAKFDFAYHWQNSSTVEASSSLSQSDRLELRGCQEEAPRFPHLGRRFIPKNVGYALVTSGLADVFVSRLSLSGRMVGYQVLPVEGMPPDVNTITFLMNPAYTMAGSLDGLTGSAPTSQRFHRHVPGMRAQYGSLYPASYYRLQEAYNLKAEIDKRDQQRQAYFNQFNAGMVDETSLNRHISSAGSEPDAVGSPGDSIAVGADDTSPEMKELDAKIAAKKAQIELAETSGKPEDAQRVPLLKAEENALQKQRSDLSTKEQESRKKEGAARQHEIDAKHKDLSARAHATDSFASWQRTMENLQIRAAKRNIVNNYVWDGDGGFHAEEQQFASTVEHSIGGSFDMGFAMGGKASLAVGKVLVELSAYAKLSLTQTMNKTQTTSTGMELHVDLGGVESRRITDHRDYPLFPGEKVDRYRFMSFYLENNASHWHDFFNTVVDPEWLSSNDEEARALRQTRQALPNKVWRVLHRVTYVERPTLMGFGRQQAPVNELSDAMQELQVQVQELTTKVDKVQRTLDAQE